MNKKPLFLISLILVSIAAFGFFYLKEAKASSTDNVSGWAWSENIGWISFNCTNLGTCGLFDYGVNVSTSTGFFSGYAWSENIGWIDFAPAGTYPASPNYQACLDLPGVSSLCSSFGDYKLSGWARACSVFQTGCSGPLAASILSGGWDGWIKLSGVSYGVSLSTTTDEMERWSWGGDDTSTEAVIGWVSFNCKNNSSCFSVDYQVKVNAPLNGKPNKPTSLSEVYEQCWDYTPRVAPGLSIILNWSSFNDPDGDSQAAYEVWVATSSSFTDPKFNHLVNRVSDSYTLNLVDDDNDDWINNPPGLSWDTDYYWSVRVQDNQGNWSDWSDFKLFRTPRHAAPKVDFSLSPLSPPVGQVTTFLQNPTSTTPSLCYNGGEHGCQLDALASYQWNFGNGKTSSYRGNATTTYDDVKSYTAILRITDNSLSPAVACSFSKNINTQFPLPIWREISPF